MQAGDGNVTLATHRGHGRQTEAKSETPPCRTNRDKDGAPSRFQIRAGLVCPYTPNLRRYALGEAPVCRWNSSRK